MSAIAYYLESEGVQTTGISLVRENTQSLRPPRFLWTTFPLGRPLGVPGDASFQRRVILAALELFRRPSGPILEDYWEDAPPVETDAFAACPVSFARPVAETSTWSTRLFNELQQMTPWYELSCRRRGRSTVGIAKSPIMELVPRLATPLDTGTLAGIDFRGIKHALEDLKAYYREALTAQPGDYDHAAIERVLWTETELGRAMFVLDDLLAGDPAWQNPRRTVVPRAARNWEIGANH